MSPLSDQEEAYVRSILGQRTPLKLAKNQNSLLVADSLWNRGQDVDRASISCFESPFANALKHLLDGELLESYEWFVKASKDAKENEHEGLLAVFFSERAVNVRLTSVVLVSCHVSPIPIDCLLDGIFQQDGSSLSAFG